MSTKIPIGAPNWQQTHIDLYLKTDGAEGHLVDFTAAGGHAAAVELLDRRPDVDAVFAASDLVAFGVVRALRERGREVGDDVAVIGFDDIPAAADQQPPLSTVKQPIAALGTAMTRLLLDRIEGRSGLTRRTVLPVELVLRETA